MDLSRFMLPCFSKSLFGIDCPGCGMQRSFVMVLHGDFQGAFQLFPAIFTTIFFFGFAILHFADKSRNYLLLLRIFGIVNGIIMIVSYLLKINKLYF